MPLLLPPPIQLIVCTSSTHPGTPYVGMWIFETDTGNLLQYQSATTGFTPPWNTAWGEVGRSVKTANQGAITTITDVTNMSVTWTAVANRRYKITVKTQCTNSVASIQTGFVVTDAANVVMDTALSSSVPVAGGSGSLQAWSYDETGIAAGSNTRKLRATAAANTSTINAGISTFVGNSFFIVEDIGPNGAPA